MPTPPDETISEYMFRMSDGTGQQQASEPEIKQNIRDSFTDIGDVYTDAGLIPPTATGRGAGTFLDAHSAKEYLYAGGLVATNDTGDEMIPLGYVYFLESYDPFLEDYVFEVYIDEDTG